MKPCTAAGLKARATRYRDDTPRIRDYDEEGVFVNLFVASEVEWPGKRLRIVQDTKFREEEGTTFTVRARKPVRIPLCIRVLYWAARGAARLNGAALETFAAPPSYFVIDRTWQDGDRLEIDLPMGLHDAPLPDDPSVRAIMYGPIVLAGRLGTEGLTKDNLRAEPTKPRMVPEYKGKPVPAPAFTVDSDDPQTWIKPVAGRPLEFQTAGQAKNVTLVPLYRVIDERYGVYWRIMTTECPRKALTQ